MPALAALLCALVFPSPGHGASTPAFRNFDHITTGFELLGQHRNVPCESCHANAIFKGTPTACASCHGVGTAVRASAKPATHILSTDQCQDCHTPWAWNPA
ncbi:MAG TPA: cytochrome c3 family protein, partial [Burkholderiales bacterium]|nr:cytochrome c3 family protein [Burkholderiales bacterium]